MTTLTWLFFSMAVTIGGYIGYKIAIWRSNKTIKKQSKIIKLYEDHTTWRP